MCLNLGDCEQMLKPVVPPTETAKKWRIVLTVMAIIHLCLAICYCFANTQSGIFEIIIVSILCCSIASVNFCCLTMYMIYITLNFFTFFSYIGLVIQNQSFTAVFTSGSSPIIFQFVIICLLCIYDLIAVILCFYAYREFKGMLFDVTGSGVGMLGPGFGGQSAAGSGSAYSASYAVDNRNRQQSAQMANIQQARPAQSQNPWQGRGVAIGGST